MSNTPLTTDDERTHHAILLKVVAQLRMKLETDHIMKESLWFQMSWDIELAIAEHWQGRNISPQSHIINNKAKLITTSWCEQYALTTDEEHTHHAILFKKLLNNLAWNWKQTTLKKRELRGVFQMSWFVCLAPHNRLKQLSTSKPSPLCIVRVLTLAKGQQTN